MIKKYAEHTLDAVVWFSHVFNPSHTVVVFIGLMPPSGSNIYRFWAYQKKDLPPNASSVYALEEKGNNWEYVEEYDYATVYAPWDFENIAFDGKRLA